jgi:hypothetical protein
MFQEEFYRDARQSRTSPGTLKKKLDIVRKLSIQTKTRHRFQLGELSGSITHTKVPKREKKTERKKNTSADQTG